MSHNEKFNTTKNKTTKLKKGYIKLYKENKKSFYNFLKYDQFLPIYLAHYIFIIILLIINSNNNPIISFYDSIILHINILIKLELIKYFIKVVFPSLN